MTSHPVSKHLCVVFVVLGALISATTRADLVFTSVPRTDAAVGQAYSYRMTAANVLDDDDDGDGDGDGDDEDDEFGRRIRFIARALPAWLEFDGNDTIFGTPRPEDIGAHKVKLRARVRGDDVDQEFSITVDALPSGPAPEGADLAASITVTPNAVSAGGAASWRVTARNLSDADVANILLETAFSGDALFTLDDVDDESCSIEPRGDHTAVACRWSPLMSGDARSAEVTGHAGGAGEIVAVARVSIVDTTPTDRNAANDEARVVLTVTDGNPDGGGGADGGSPVLTLNGASTMTVTVGETYQDPGATAIDDADGDLTSQIVVDNPVDTNVIGRYSVTYDVVDGDGNVTTATRTVEVIPREPAGGGGGGAAGIGLLLLVSAGIFARLTRKPPGRPAHRRALFSKRRNQRA